MSPLKQSTNHRGPDGSLECEAPEDRHLRLARVRHRIRRHRRQDRHEDDRPERRERRRGPHGRPHRPRRRLQARRADGVRARPVADEEGATSRPSAAVVDDTITKLESHPQVSKLRSPYAKGNEGQISPDGHSVLIQFSPKGSYDEAVKYIDTITAGTAAVQKAHPDYLVAEAGSASTGKALDAMFNSQLARAGLISIPITLLILLLVFRSLVGAFIPLLLALTAVIATIVPRRDPEPDRPDGSGDLGGDPPDRACGRSRLLPVLRPPRTRRAAQRQERDGRPRGRRGDIRPGRAHLRRDRDDRDGRHVPLRRQDVHVLRDRHDDGRRRRDDRLADRPARDAVVARRPRRQGARPVPRPQAVQPRGPVLGRDPRRRPPPPARLGDRRRGRPRRAGAPGAEAAHDAVRLRRVAEVDEGSPVAQRRPGRVPRRRDARPSSRSRAT